MIEMRRVNKFFQEGEAKREVLQDLDLSVGEGDSVLLLGRSGSGKSTLLNLISGMDLPTSGEVKVAGVDLSRMGEKERTLFRRKQVGFIFQSFNLIPTLTLAENLLLPLQLNGRTGKNAVTEAMHMLDKVGLADRARSFPDVLSGGEQQRVAIARALVHDPALVLADEPTGNLDAENGQRVMQWIGHLTAASGKTLVVVSHNPEWSTVCRRRLILEKGRLRELPADVSPPASAEGLA